MTPDEIIALAKRVGFPIRHPDWQKAAEEFAALVEERATAKEREACALLCYEQRKNWDALACADAIRAGTRPRGQA